MSRLKQQPTDQELADAESAENGAMSKKRKLEERVNDASHHSSSDAFDFIH